MTLILSMLRCPERVAPETRQIEGGEFSIGRAPGNDWVLPDPERHLSKRHCLLAYRSGSWQIVDLSTNGTFLNRDAKPLERGGPRPLNDGDRLVLGPYEIEVGIAEVPAVAPQRSGDPFPSDPFASPAGFGPDPLLAGDVEHNPFAQAVAPASINLPPDYDPLSPVDAEVPIGAPTAPDHSPHLKDALRPPRIVLPEDWDRNFAAVPAAAPPVGETGLAPQPGPVAPAPAHAPSAAPGTDLLAAFLRGAGLKGARFDDPEATMERLGAAFRALVSELRQTLVARAAIKSEFRIGQTMIRRSGNNPLKFSADDDDALVALVGAGRRTDMAAADAVADALRDIRLHELATISAMQSAVRALLAEFNPAKLRRAAEKNGLNLIAVQKKAHAWDAFEALHTRLYEAMSDNFDSVFGTAFAQAYERALAEAAGSEDRS
jgi:type VI secretion system FHA domain protein